MHGIAYVTLMQCNHYNLP